MDTSLLDQIINQWGQNAVFGVVLLFVLRWTLQKVDYMITTLKEALDNAGSLIQEEQNEHKAIMQALQEITTTQIRIVDSMARLESSFNERKQP